MNILFANDGTGRCLIESDWDEGDGLTIRTMPDPLFGPKPKRRALRKRFGSERKLEKSR